MDSTYKTNRYNMPLFEMVGVTSTDKTFNIAFLSNEKDDNFTWALQECQKLVRGKEMGPNVVVNDRDPALMNAVDVVFLDAPLVCCYHVVKNVTEKCKQDCEVRDAEKVKHSDVVKSMTDAFEDLLNSLTKERYAQTVVEFRELCKRWPRFLTLQNPFDMQLDEMS
jgi:hypothetical protein